MDYGQNRKGSLSWREELTLLDEMMEMVSITDEVGNLLYVNTAHRLLGYSLDELMASSPQDYVHPEDRPHLKEIFDRLVREDRPFRAVYRILCSDGTYLSVETIGTRRNQTEGRKQYLFSTREQSHRMSRAFEKRCVEEEIRWPVDGRNEMLFTVGEDLIYRKVFSSIANELHSEQYRFENRHVFEVDFPEPTKTLLIDAFTIARDSGRSERVIYSLVIKSEERWFEAQFSPMRDEDHQLSMLCSVRETTEKYYRHNGLLESMAEVAKFFSINMDLMLVMDRKGHILRINEGWVKKLGYDLDELQGKHFTDFLHPEDIGDSMVALRMIENLEPVETFVNRYRCKHGGYLKLRWRSSIEGERVFGVGRDITDQSREEEILRNLVEISESFLDSEKDFDAQRRIEEFRVLFGVLAVFLNVYNAKGDQFRTKGYSLRKDVPVSLARWFSYSLERREWTNDPIREELIGTRPFVRFKSFADLVERAVDTPGIHPIHEIFSTGEVVVVGILSKRKRLGDITLVMPKDEPFKLEYPARVLANQLGLVMNRELSTESMDRVTQCGVAYHLLLDQMDQGIALFRLVEDSYGNPVDFVATSVNATFLNLLGKSESELLDKSGRGLFAQMEDQWMARFVDVVRTGVPSYYKDFIVGSGSILTMHVLRPKADHFVLVVNKITEYKALEQGIDNRNRLLTRLAEQIPGGIYQYVQYPDGRSAFPFASTGIESVYGLKPEHIAEDASGVFEKIHPEDYDHVVASIRRSEREMTIWKDEYRVIHPTKGLIWIQGQARPERLTDGGTLWHGYLTDITKLKDRQERIEYLSFHDALTDLYNRRYMEDAMKHLDTKRQRPFTLMLIDVNGLKFINDAFGHQAGDQLLMTVAKVLRDACRKEDRVGRMGGDEFLILLPQTDEIEARRIATRIKSTMATHRLAGIPVSVAIGSATKRDDQQSIEAVLKSADFLMYEHKRKEGPKRRAEAVELLATQLQERLPMEKEHIEGVRKYAKEICVCLNLLDSEIRVIDEAARLHDLGKIAVPKELIEKPLSLTPTERELVRQHTETAYQMLSSSQAHASIAEIVRHHHEQYDGNGYPTGLSKTQIPLGSRILAVADALASMLADRPYRSRRSLEEAYEELRKCSGSQFDPEIVATFLSSTHAEEER